jgi:hypothetical protein
MYNPREGMSGEGIVLGVDGYPIIPPPKIGQLILGVDVGQRVDYTAAVLVELKYVEENGQEYLFFNVRSVERFPLGTTYATVRDTLLTAFKNWEAHVSRENGSSEHRPYIVLDATGVGAGLYDLLEEKVREFHGLEGRLIRVTITGGESEPRVEGSGIYLPKAKMVSSLIAAIQSGRMAFPDTRLADELRDEILNFDLSSRGTGTPELGALKSGTHDDLVTALGLACFHARRRFKRPYRLPLPIEILKTDWQEPAFCSAFDVAEHL